MLTGFDIAVCWEEGWEKNSKRALFLHIGDDFDIFSFVAVNEKIYMFYKTSVKTILKCFQQEYDLLDFEQLCSFENEQGLRALI